MHLMTRSNFENLTVYRLSEDLSDKIWEIVKTWDIFSRNTIGEQLVDAADSIGANIAEGTGRGSYADNKRFVRIARGSLYETKHFLRRAYRRKLLDESQVNELTVIINELTPKLNAYINSIGRNATDK
jgi:four helix bundle protein